MQRGVEVAEVAEVAEFAEVAEVAEVAEFAEVAEVAEGCRGCRGCRGVQVAVSMIVCFPWCRLAQDGGEGSECNGSWRVPCMA